MRNNAWRLNWIIRAALAALIVCTSPYVGAHGTDAHANDAEKKEPPLLAPGYEALLFDAPEVGSYNLPPLGKAADGLVLSSNGDAVKLSELMVGKITVLSFIYRACDDINGCPLATYVMQQLRSSLETDKDLGDKVRLISLSFDPGNDTPESMDAYKNSFAKSDVEWHFVTTESHETLTPILSAYNQPISRSSLASGSDSINHLLRVYLIDEQQSIRNIYSANLLHADTLLNDIKTLAQSVESSHDVTIGQSASVENPTQPENRSGYSSGDYTSQSFALQRNGVTADLYAIAVKPTLGLPALENSEQLSVEKINLGRALFFDRRLSINNTFSCAMCHIPQQAFTSNELATSVGVEGRTVKRNAPTLINVGFLKRLFHDGRESKLEQQVWSPLLAHNEMANPSVGYVLDKINNKPSYQLKFEQAFGIPEANMQNLGEALAAYQSSLIAGNSAFDQWFYANEKNALSENAQAGFALFNGKADCVSCHTVQENFALFTDESMHNTGIGYQRSMFKRTEPHEVTLAPGIVVKVDPADYASAAEPPPNDLGLYEVTQNPDDRWKFRTPGLRNVALTAPYMHDGSFETLLDVVRFYNDGGIDNPELSPLIKPLGLTEQEMAQLVEFLGSLNGDSLSVLVNDGLAAPIGDVSHTLQ